MPALPRRHALAALLLALAACGGSGPAPGPAAEPGAVDVTTPQAYVRVTVPADGAFRVRLSRTPDFPALPSFAVDPAALPAGAPYTVEAGEAAVVVRAGAWSLRVERSPLRLALLDAQGQVVAQEAAPVTWQGEGARLRWELAPEAHAYGLGDPARGLDRRGKAFTLWNTDAYGWGPDSDQLYKSIPFLVITDGARAHGLFVDNPSRTLVDVGAASPSVLAWSTSRAPVVDLYLLAGPDPHAVVGAFTALTGRPPLPPRWALGYHQCRYSYATEAVAREVAARLRADAIPADALWLDIDYQQGYAPFTVNGATFPDFAGMVADLSAQGLRTVVITDPHIAAIAYPPYQSGLAGDHFVRDRTGAVYLDSVWPGPSAFPEFTLARTRAWWGGLYADLVARGVAGFWNDMNEPAIFNAGQTMPDDNRHRLDDGRTVDHVTVHNAWGALNARATYEGALALRPGVRPFVLTRAGYAGAQRWAATWTGDNGTSWDHLATTIPQLANLGVSGWAFAGADVGGFTGCPDATLMAEWTEVASLQPFFRSHSQGSCWREPWRFGATTEARLRAAVERRYRLLPYLYTAFEEASRTGLPVMRPLWFEYPEDPTTADAARAFLVGRDLLVAPRLGGPATFTAPLPAADWWDLSTGGRVSGGGPVQVTTPADESLRLFARAGAILPGQPLAQTAAETPAGALTLDVWPGPDCAGGLYLDDGESLAYQQGAARRVTYACTPGASGITVTAGSAGSFPTWWSATQVVLHGVPAAAAYDVSALPGDGAPPPWSYDAARQALTVTLDGDGADWTLTAAW